MKLDGRLRRLEDEKERAENAALRQLTDEELSAIAEMPPEGPTTPTAKAAMARVHELVQEYIGGARLAMTELEKVARHGNGR